MLITLILMLVPVSCTDSSTNNIESEDGSTLVSPYIQNMSQTGLSVLWTSLKEIDGKVIIRDTNGETVAEF